ncbi:MAG: type II toxin-antitoxin system HigA family antitoxin [Synechococcus sp.]
MTLTSSAVAPYLPWATPSLLKTEQEYQQAMAALESMMSGALTPEQSDLFDLLTILIEKYEDEHYPIDEATPHQVLQHLMEENGIKQAQLVGVIGSSGVVSEVVNGKREISKNQAKALGEFFSVDFSVFL